MRPSYAPPVPAKKPRIGRPPRAKKPGKHITMRLTEPEIARWTREADRRGVSLSALIREAVEAYVAR